MTNYELLNVLIDIETEAIIRKQRDKSVAALLDDVMDAFYQAHQPFSPNVLNLVADLDKLIEGVNEFFVLNYKN